MAASLTTLRAVATTVAGRWAVAETTFLIPAYTGRSAALSTGTGLCLIAQATACLARWVMARALAIAARRAASARSRAQLAAAIARPASQRPAEATARPTAPTIDLALL